MKAHEIRTVLTNEADRLSSEGIDVVAQGLLTYATTATDDELTRLANLIANFEPRDFWNPTDRLIIDATAR